MSNSEIELKLKSKIKNEKEDVKSDEEVDVQKGDFLAEDSPRFDKSDKKVEKFFSSLSNIKE